MPKMSNKEFFDKIKEHENKEYGYHNQFNVLDENLDEIKKSFLEGMDKNPLENENNVYTVCKISQKEAKNGCKKTIQIERKIEDKLEKNTMKINIPPNIQAENKIILYGEGNREKEMMGNLIVEIKIQQGKI